MSPQLDLLLPQDVIIALLNQRLAHLETELDLSAVKHEEVSWMRNELAGKKQKQSDMRVPRQATNAIGAKELEEHFELLRQRDEGASAGRGTHRGRGRGRGRGCGRGRGVNTSGANAVPHERTSLSKLCNFNQTQVSLPFGAMIENCGFAHRSSQGKG
ncbi:hypothetical protein P7C70_g6408, partial [Phenoliferia sp. Uapishka_3]